MALIKCKECGQDISTDALTCPHCGKPNIPIVVEQAYPKKETAKALTGFLILVIIGILIYYSPHRIWQNLFSKTVPSVFTPPQNVSGHEIPLQEVKNLGYTFLIGQIDSAGTNNLTDDFKNQVTKIIHTAHFPQSILNNLPIIVLNNLALTGDQYVKTSAGILKIPELKADWLSEGGMYATFTNGSPVIFLNKPIIAQGQLVEVLTHELGHAIGNKLTDQDWQDYYSLRGITEGTPRRGTNWNLSPVEDFAEVYKNTFTGIEIRTFHGQLVPRLGTDIGSCGIIHLNTTKSYLPKIDPKNPVDAFTGQASADYSVADAKANLDPKVLACRRDVLVNPSTHQSDWMFGTPYKSTVTKETKEFIISILNHFNP